jgi:hypothetical protein
MQAEMKLKRFALGLLVVTAMLGWAHSKDARPDGFYYSMSLEAANELLDSDSQYEVVYRIDTASTADIFCNYLQKTQYLAHFLHGDCCGVEKRAVVEAAAMHSMFSAYRAALGEPHEGATTQDSKTHYAHWTYKDRELELTALRRSDGRYLLIHEEYDPRRAGEVRVLQERELKDSPTGQAELERQRLVAE